MTSPNDPTRRTGDDEATRPDTPSAGRRASAEPDAVRDGRPTAPPADGTPPTGRRAADRPAVERRPEERGSSEEEPVSRGGGKTAGLWIALVLGAIILVLLLIFVLQNNTTAGFQYFGSEFDLPLGIAMLLAAIAGALVMALVGSVRMVQMSWTIRKLRKQQEKIHRATR